MYKQTAQAVLGIMLALCPPGCVGDEAGTDGDESAGECEDGNEGCPCAGGDACAVGLMCISNACIDPGAISGDSSGNSSTSTTGGETSTGSSSTGSGTSSSSGSMPDSCISNAQCSDSEICYYSECTEIADLYFDVIVQEFDPPDCSDGWGDAEIYYDYYENDEYMLSSTIVGCPGLWPDEIIPYDPNQSFLLEFWESDAISDDLITTLCWGGDPCQGIPTSILREGSWAGLDATDTYYLDLVFSPAIR